LTANTFTTLFHQTITVMKIHSLAFLLLFQIPFAGNDALEFLTAPNTDSQQKLNRDKSGTVNIVFKSTDGGQTWQDISEGLPENLQGDDLQRDGFFANNSGVYLRAGNGIYHTKPNSTAPFWKEEIFPGKHGSIAPGKSGIFAYNYEGQILQKIKGTSVWSPMYTNFQGKVRTVFETAEGTVFIGSDNGLFKSTNSGKTWKDVHAGGWVMKLVESNGVLVATSMRGIIRSTDDGENWALVISEGGVGIDVARIQGGFAAITFNTKSNTRRVRTSYDGGKTWQPIDAGLPAQAFIFPVDKALSQVNPPDSVWHQVDPADSVWNPLNTSLPEQAFITSIVQVGKYFFCGHPTGIFRSSDKGKTWKLVLPSIEEKVFNLSVWGNVIYAIPTNRGC
jgi:photosystem II stability/assembly factor-like uncharacterized protein